MACTHEEHPDAGLAATVALQAAVLVEDGAVVSGGRATAVWQVDTSEHERRQASGLGAVTDVSVLDALMTLPRGVPIRRADLDPDAHWLVTTRTPAAAIRLSETTVERLIGPPGEVLAVLTSGRTWRQALLRAGAFSGFAARIVIVERLPKDPRMLLTEADVFGIGVWQTGSDGFVEHLAPAPFRRRYWKAAAWRFAERAYERSITPTRGATSAVQRIEFAETPQLQVCSDC